METGEGHLEFDGSSTCRGGGSTFVPYALHGTTISLCFKLGCPCLSKEAEYEALIVWLIFVYRRGFPSSGCKKIPSSIKQVNEEFALKEIVPLPNRTSAQR